LRVLEAGEFIKVGSSKVLKSNVRVVAATNVDIENAIQEGKFREDLFYRLNSIPIKIPPLRDRSEDIYLIFRKFVTDFADKYRMPPIKLDEEARELLLKYRWPGNIRQLKNITEQVSIIEKARDINADILRHYIPYHRGDNLPAIIGNTKKAETDFSNEREILYKVLFDMKRDMNDLKSIVLELLQQGDSSNIQKDERARIFQNLYPDVETDSISNAAQITKQPVTYNAHSASHPIEDTEEFVEESLSIEDKEVELINKALEKHSGKRKYAAQELGISERTLYRKIKEYDIDG